MKTYKFETINYKYFLNASPRARTYHKSLKYSKTFKPYCDN